MGEMGVLHGGGQVEKVRRSVEKVRRSVEKVMRSAERGLVCACAGASNWSPSARSAHSQGRPHRIG
eukprot:931434-Prymnesium_polylepis.1